MKLEYFLENKPLFYKEINRARMPSAFKFVQGAFKIPKIIHLIGTNGKGSTGRFLAQMLARGHSVGHYTSPHIFEFRERFWMNGAVASADALETAHERLIKILPVEVARSLSYFEYATLLCAPLFEGCDFFVCEAGVGGEFDATNVFDKRLSLFTPIGFDHTALLGDTLEQIATTKFNAMADVALMNDEMGELCVGIARQIAAKKGVTLKFASENLSDDDKNEIKIYAEKFGLPEFLRSNLTLSSSAFKELGFSLNLANLGALDLNGRCEKIAPNVTIDVGHNEMAAQALVKRFEGKKLNLIFNAFADKDIKAVLKAIKPIVKKTYIIEYEAPGRELATAQVKEALRQLDMEFADFTDVRTDEEYLAFGSFYLVEAFLKRYRGAK
ncbi:bifunctional folylpolyglutamate synthase/dihydrofolate synthase [Campylobacter showae]|uniref:Dihydrofolate synthase / Folylpolyglutamate synthase n=1 Tax=Campylobacter showae CSUNSWCD TaxID=1244083 RepID=M5IR25_9BACT|nr:bifunctional folylpolyglutamate synthase/dihydrofolate synthase [Campylobacter showae]EKU10908.1 Dihydrofolate synthase / Folylpolyglutamate synthase [Campylobacter showae CSUNSWCD]